MKKLVLFIIILFLAGCKSKNDIQLETAAKIYVENIILEDKYSNKPDTVILLRDKVYEKYKLSKEEYKKIFDGFAVDKDKWSEFFTLSEKYLDSLRNKNTLN